MDLADQELAAIKDIAAGASQETLYQYFSLLLKGSEEMQYSSRPRLALEMAFLRATQAGQIVPAAALLGRLDELLAGVVPESRSVARPVFAPISTAEPESAPSQPRTAPAVSATYSVPLAEEKIKERTEAATPLPEQSPPALSVLHQGREVKRDWGAFVEYVKKRKHWMAPVLQLCAMPREEGGQLILKFDDPSDCKLLREHDNLKLLQSFVLDFFQNDFRTGDGGKGNQ